MAVLVIIVITVVVVIAVIILVIVGVVVVEVFGGDGGDRLRRRPRYLVAFTTRRVEYSHSRRLSRLSPHHFVVI